MPFSLFFFPIVVWNADVMAVVLAAMRDHEDEDHILRVVK